MRTNRHQYFLDLAARCARQGTCLRRNFGAIIVDEFNTIVSTGYTGAPRKQMDCTELSDLLEKGPQYPVRLELRAVQERPRRDERTYPGWKTGAGVHALSRRVRCRDRRDHPDLALFPLLEDDRKQRRNKRHHADRHGDFKRDGPHGPLPEAEQGISRRRCREIRPPIRNFMSAIAFPRARHLLLLRFAIFHNTGSLFTIVYAGQSDKKCGNSCKKAIIFVLTREDRDRLRRSRCRQAMLPAGSRLLPSRGASRLLLIGGSIVMVSFGVGGRVVVVTVVATVA